MNNDQKLIYKYNNRKKYLFFLFTWVLLLFFSIILSINYFLMRYDIYLVNNLQLKFALELMFYVFWFLTIISNWFFSLYFWAKKSYEKLKNKQDYSREIKLLRFFHWQVFALNDILKIRRNKDR